MLRVLYFAKLSDELGTKGEALEWQDNFITINDVKNVLIQRGTPWDSTLEGDIMHALNHQIVQPEHRIADGDEIAFFPPVTGG